MISDLIVATFTSSMLCCQNESVLIANLIGKPVEIAESYGGNVLLGGFFCSGNKT